MKSNVPPPASNPFYSRQIRNVLIFFFAFFSLLTIVSWVSQEDNIIGTWQNVTEGKSRHERRFFPGGKVEDGFWSSNMWTAFIPGEYTILSDGTLQVRWIGLVDVRGWLGSEAYPTKDYKINFKRNRLIMTDEDGETTIWKKSRKS